MAITADEILVRMIAQNQQYIDSMKTARAATSSVEEQLKILRDTMGKSAPNGGMSNFTQNVREADQSIRNLQFNLPNFAAQVNDIGVTAAGGMQPWLIAVQQGTQLNQAFAGQSARDAFKQMGAAIASVLSPQSILVLGLVAGAAALIQWTVASLDMGDSAEKLSKSLEKLVKDVDALKDVDSFFGDNGVEKIVEKFGVVNERVYDLIRAQRQLAEVNAMQSLADSMEEIAKVSESKWYDLGISDFQSSIVNLRSQFDITARDAKILYSWFEELSNAPLGSDRQIAAMTNLRDMFLQIHAAGGDGADEALRMANIVQDGATQAQILLALAGDIPGQFGAAADEAARVRKELNDAVSSAEKMAAAAEKRKEAETRKSTFADDPVGLARANAVAEFDDMFSISERQLRSVDALKTRYVEAAVSAAEIAEANRVAKEETEEALKAETKIADRLERDKEASLEKIRTLEQEARLQEAINKFGGDSIQVARERQAIDRETFEAWVDSLTVQDEMKKSLLEAYYAAEMLSDVDLQSGISAAANEANRLTNELLRAVAAADNLRNAGIEDLTRAEIELKYRTDPIGKAGALAGARFDSAVKMEDQTMDFREYNRRKKEIVDTAIATATLKEEIRELDEADRKSARVGGGGGSASKTVDRADDKIRKEIAALKAETAVLEGAEVGYDRYGNAVERARKEAEILQNLTNQGIHITDEIRKNVSDLADEWMRVADENQIAAEKLERLKSISDEVAGNLRTAFDGVFTDASRALEDLGKQFLMIALKMQLSRWFPAVFGAGGFMDLGYDSGGYTGDGGRYQPAGIVHKGEYVFDQDTVKAAGGPGVLESLRHKLRGYSSGSYVGALPTPVHRSSSPQVQILDYRSVDSPDVEVSTKTGPSGEEMLQVMIGKQLARGKYDKPLSGRYLIKAKKAIR
jgi:hypothetical protein